MQTKDHASDSALDIFHSIAYHHVKVQVLALEMTYPSLQHIALLQSQTCCSAQANSIHVWSLENREVMTANPFPLVHAVRRIQKRLEGPEGKGHGMTVPVLHTDSGQPYILFQVSGPSTLWAVVQKKLWGIQTCHDKSRHPCVSSWAILPKLCGV